MHRMFRFVSRIAATYRALLGLLRALWFVLGQPRLAPRVTCADMGERYDDDLPVLLRGEGERIVMGPAQPTDFADGWDLELVTSCLDRWMRAGISMTMMETDDVGRQLAEVLGVVLAHPAIDVPDLRLAPRGEAAG